VPTALRVADGLRNPNDCLVSGVYTIWMILQVLTMSIPHYWFLEVGGLLGLVAIGAIMVQEGMSKRKHTARDRVFSIALRAASC